ncbi:MAG: class I SAM-dependent DNA methyltransferase, partial [Desulfovibrio sp.]|nr:class I SAM-dependent DNA methyltransferase [Desulfovibrio sp.]
MASELNGIDNQNEFFSSYYISALLERDLTTIFARWRDRKQKQHISTPPEQLAAYGRDWLRRKRRSTSQEDVAPLWLGVLRALGYEPCPTGELREVFGGLWLEIKAEICRSSGAPELWAVLTYADKSTQDPLQLPLVLHSTADSASLMASATDNTASAPPDFPCADSPEDKTALPDDSTDADPPEDRERPTAEYVLNRHIFASREPPRYVLLFSTSQLVLIDREKWPSRRCLRFDFDTLFARREESTLAAVAAFAHRDSLCPQDGLSLLDSLEENSRRHAAGVSEDLKYALRESIELLGNEVVRSLREDVREKVFDGALSPKELSLQCLRYMYRLLFLLFMEARPELNYVPCKSETYLQGYSLESLRSLELLQLTDDESRDGTFLQQSLELLFAMIWQGHNGHDDSHSLVKRRYEFDIAPLKSHLFDPQHTELLHRAKLRNVVLQRVIQCLSLTRPGHGRRRRISYAQLGINQLGAVYEALLSYRGFFAEDDLCEIKADEAADELQTAYFVPTKDMQRIEQRFQSMQKSKVFFVTEKGPDGYARTKIYPKGSFIYRMAGRDRETSASYYTPEALTGCLVKYALKELLQGKTADDILKITVCEPAMGSAAFLNEAVNQLAQAYLERKQQELDKHIPADQYEEEKQHVKMYLADNNVFGVDLNPVAVELAEVSLWLNTISADGVVPWFGNQLCCGNSLVGARRQVWPVDLLSRKNAPWCLKAPRRVTSSAPRQKDEVYHFLLPDKDMASYEDKVIRGLLPQAVGNVKRWKRAFCAPFLKEEVTKLRKLSAQVDKLWRAHRQKQAELRRRTADPLHVWGQPTVESRNRTSVQQKDRILRLEQYSEGLAKSTPYRRLKLVMDYWCALWFWPLEQADLLPSREEWLCELSLVLEGTTFVLPPSKVETMRLPGLELPTQTRLPLVVEDLGSVDVDNLCEKLPRLTIVRDLAAKFHFHHWELEFADIFHERGGFDLVLGNPPWIKLEWNEGAVMGDHDPLFVLLKLSAAQLANLREEALQRPGLQREYVTAYCGMTGMQNFLNAAQNYPVLQGSQSNLFKCFLPQAWMLGNDKGVSAFVHPEGVYDDPNGGRLRREMYPRLRYHFQFENEENLFTGTNDHGRMRFGLNVYGEPQPKVHFHNMVNLYRPSTINESFEHKGQGPVGGIKDEKGQWNTKGHKDRIVQVNDEILNLLASLYDSSSTPALEARLPALHATELLPVLRCFAEAPQKLGKIGDEYFSLEMWHETNAQKTGIIRRVEDHFPESLQELVLSGPHFYVGNPLNKTPRRVCTQNSHYDVLDLTTLPDSYLPRTNYVPDCDAMTYKECTPKVSWDMKPPVTCYYRLCIRGMLSSSMERTMVAMIAPEHIAHTHAVRGYAFKYTSHLLQAAAGAFSLPFDFFVKSTGRGNLHQMLDAMPLLPPSTAMQVRVLALSCLTTHYADLWEECFTPYMKNQRWAKADPRLPDSFFAELTPTWQRT